MGTFHYGTDTSFDIDDVTLAHLSAIVVAKLRRAEAFTLTLPSGEGRQTLWIHPAASVRCAFTPNEQHGLDRERLDEMMRSTHRGSGLVLAAAAPAVSAVAVAA
jgi:hypothetical protein